MRSALVVALASVGLTGAQQVQNYTSALDMTIDPNSVDPQKRATWCGSEGDTCSQLCDRSTKSNWCDPPTLKYECKCTSNNSAPALQYYANSMPSNICNELFDRCNEQYIGNADAQKLCITNIQDLCGTQSAAKAPEDSGSSSDSSSSSAASNTSDAPKATGKDSDNSGASTSTSSGFAAPTKAPGQGIAAAAAALGVFAYVV